MTTEEKVREIGGRRFRFIENGTLEQDTRATVIMHKIGMDGFAIKEGETELAFATRLHWHVLESGWAYDLLGAITVPDKLADHKWTPAIGSATTHFLCNLIQRKEQLEARQVLADFNVFFAKGLLLKELSPIASQGKPEVPAEIPVEQIT